MARGRSSSWGTTAAVLAVTLASAVCFVLIKAGLAYAPALRFGGLRALIGGLSLFVVATFLRHPLLPGRRSWPAILALACSATTLGFGAMFLSPGRAGAGIASVLGNTQPLLAVVLAAAFLGERASSRAIAAVLLGTLGVLLIAFPALRQPGTGQLTGALLALTASAGFAAGTVLIKRMGPQGSVLVVTAWQLTLGSLPLFAVSWATERGVVTWSGEFVGILVSLAVAGTALVNAAWYWLVQREPVTRITPFLFLVPVLGLLLAALVYGEAVSAPEAAGLVLTLAGVAITGLTARERRQA